MAHIRATLRDEMRYQQKRLFDPKSAFKAQPNTNPSAQADMGAAQPHASLVQDPMLNWGKAFEDYHDFQVQSGMEIMRSGIAPQTAAEMDHVRTAQGEFNRPGLDPSRSMAQPYGTQSGHDQAMHRLDPWNNPLSTVPGGLLGPPPIPGA